MHKYAFSPVADLRGARGRRAPLGVQILSISCSFWKILAKSYVGAPLGSWCPLLGEILDPPLLPVMFIYLFLSLSLPPVFEFMATARMVMGSGFLVLSPNLIKARLPWQPYMSGAHGGHCPSPFGQWPRRGKT